MPSFVYSMTMALVKLRYNSKLVPDPGLVLQTPLCKADQARQGVSSFCFGALDDFPNDVAFLSE